MKCRTEIAFSSQTVNVSKQTWPVLGNLELVEVLSISVHASP